MGTDLPPPSPNPRLTPAYWEGYRVYPGKLDLMTSDHWAGWHAANDARALRLQIQHQHIMDGPDR
jgi:hypothetical protein